MTTPHYIVVLDKLILGIRALMKELPESDLMSLATLTGDARGDVSIGRLAVGVSEERRAKERKNRLLEKVAQTIHQSDRVEGISFPWEELSVHQREPYLQNARALLNAGLLA